MSTEALEKIDMTALSQFINPEDLAAMNDKFAGGITGGSFLPEIKYKGSRWSLRIEKEDKPVPAMNPENPYAIYVHLVDARPNVSKTFYAGGYEQDSKEKPDCSSVDGFVPDSHIEDPQNENCQTCPNNAWGSKISETGGKGKACADYKQVVVAFQGRADKAFSLRVPAASLTGYKSYISQLGFNKVPAPLAVTEISFDSTKSYPHMLFKCVGILSSREEWDSLKALAETADVRQVVQIQPRAETPKQIEAPKTAEQPVVVTEPEAPAAAPAVDLKSILEGNKKEKKTRAKKTVAEVIDESTAEPVQEAGVVNTLDELLARI